MRYLFAYLLIFSTYALNAQEVVTYDWPTEQGEAFLSDKYKITLSYGGNIVDSEVIMSKAKDIEIPNFADEFRGGRTFNWTQFSSDFSQPVEVTVEKIFGTGTIDIEVVPSPFEIVPSLSSDGLKVTFTMDKADYLCVNFKSADNMHTSDGVVKHMLMIFAEPLETNVPDKTAQGVHVYSENSTVQELTDADVVYFPKGYHDLSAQFDDVSNMKPAIEGQHGKHIYFEGGAYVHGRIYSPKADNVKVYGRGVLTGRDFKWSKNLANNGGVNGVDSHPSNHAHLGISGNNNSIEGIIVCDGAGHGINIASKNATYIRTKYWGWHPNNDGMRPWGSNNKVEHCFIRGCDDALYNKGLTVTNTIFYPSFNGSILCLGWDGKYHTENSKLIDNYIIYPEWRRIGNNHGILMSHIDYDMNGTNVLIKNLYVDGNIPALVNLHNSKSKSDVNDFSLPTDFTNKVGKVDNIVFENIHITGQQLQFEDNGYQQTPKPSKGLIRGTQLTTGQTYKMKNITFKDVYFGGECLTESKKDEYFTIDDATTENIKIISTECGTGDNINYIDSDFEQGKIQISPNPVRDILRLRGIDKKADLEVFSITGELVLKRKDNQLEVSTLPLGIYTLVVNGIVRTKFFKQ